MNEKEADRKRAEWLETISQEELDAFQPLSDDEIREALERGERDRAAAEVQGTAAPQALQLVFR